tara:strand:- start:149 stop:370 length:222 start_codon:yes stop_codon:yes gene_type:complete
MSEMKIHCKNLSANECEQLVALFHLGGFSATVFQSEAGSYYIEIGLTQSNASALEGILKYVITYIYKGESNES